MVSLKDSYDVVISGAGPAGLSLAAKMDPTLDVLVLDEGRIGYTTKSWGVLELKDLKVPDRFVANRLVSGASRTITGGEVFTKYADMPKDTSCAIIDEFEILQGWKDDAMANGVDFLEKTKFVGFDSDADSIDIHTSRQSISSRLLVGAMGYNSPLIEQLGIKRDVHYYVPIFGGYVENANFERQDAGLVSVLHEGTPTFAQYFPITQDEGIVWLFRLLKPRDFLAKSGEDWIKVLKNEYDDFTTKDPELKYAKLRKGRFGIVPMSSQSDNTRDRIFLYGDSGGTTPFSTLGFNAIYKTNDNVSNNLSSLLRIDDLSAQRLGCIETSLSDNFSETIMSLIFKMISCVKPHESRRMVEIFDRSGTYQQFAELIVNAHNNSVSPKDMVHMLGSSFCEMPMKDLARLGYLSMKNVGPVHLMKATYAIGQLYLSCVLKAKYD